jgi:hypothetical protein
MNWFERYKMDMRKFAAVRGEWWIVDGRAQYADGDVGDYNHEAMAIEAAQMILKDEMLKDPVLQQAANIIFGEQGNYDSWDPIATRSYLLDWADGAMSNGELTEDEADDIYAAIANRTGVDRETIDVAMGGDHEDARNFAMKKWGWKRLAGKTVEMWTMTPGDTKDLAEGIWDAYDDEAELVRYEIYVHGNNTHYTEVPFEAIEKGPMAIHQYRYISRRP